MNDNLNASILMCRAASALIEAMGMTALNMQRQSLGQGMAYDDDAFSALIVTHGIHHNAIYELINGPYPYDEG